MKCGPFDCPFKGLGCPTQFQIGPAIQIFPVSLSWPGLCLTDRGKKNPVTPSETFPSAIQKRAAVVVSEHDATAAAIARRVQVSLEPVKSELTT
jgi:hypothetical protein